jgi:hypothetical protein
VSKRVTTGQRNLQRHDSKPHFDDPILSTSCSPSGPPGTWQRRLLGFFIFRQLKRRVCRFRLPSLLRRRIREFLLRNRLFSQTLEIGPLRSEEKNCRWRMSSGVGVPHCLNPCGNRFGTHVFEQDIRGSSAGTIMDHRETFAGVRELRWSSAGDALLAT